jgi:hypothetical protein
MAADALVESTMLPVFHRFIGLRQQAAQVRAVIEDDYHHFRISLRHAHGKVTAIEARAFRFPWDICPQATGEIQTLKGTPLDANPVAVSRLHDARLHCTHLFDLTGLMICAAARGIQERRYLARIPNRVADRTTAELQRDGVPELVWSVEGSTITGEAPLLTRDIGTGFTAFVDRELQGDAAEAALILRRSIFVSSGRGTPLDDIEVAPAFGGCYVQRPGRAELARRQLSLRRDFTSCPQVLGTRDEAWLAFQETA